MGSTFDIVADALVQECAVAREKIRPESDVVNDLGLDSISFLDLCYKLDTTFGITIPYEQWVSDINAGKIDRVEAFRLRTIVVEIDKLVAAKERSSSDEQIGPA